MGCTRADLEKARDDIYARREGESPLQQQLRIARAQLSPPKNSKAPLASPEPIAWIKEIEKRRAAIAPPTDEEGDDDFTASMGKQQCSHR